MGRVLEVLNIYCFPLDKELISMHFDTQRAETSTRYAVVFSLCGEYCFAGGLVLT